MLCEVAEITMQCEVFVCVTSVNGRELQPTKCTSILRTGLRCVCRTSWNACWCTSRSGAPLQPTYCPTCSCLTPWAHPSSARVCSPSCVREGRCARWAAWATRTSRPQLAARFAAARSPPPGQRSATSSSSDEALSHSDSHP